MIGGGRYGKLCERIAGSLGAEVVAVLVINGKRGNGFSVAVQSDWDVTGTPEALAKLPAVLRQMADGIEKDLGK